jgi:hypothetical protein
MPVLRRKSALLKSLMKGTANLSSKYSNTKVVNFFLAKLKYFYVYLKKFKVKKSEGFVKYIYLTDSTTHGLLIGKKTKRKKYKGVTCQNEAFNSDSIWYF